MEAEKKYIQFATLEESEPQKQLREYKQYAEQKYAEVRGLHQHAKSLEQHLSDVMTKLDASISELIMVKADTTQHQSNLDGEWLSGITEYRSMHEADMIEMGTLTLQINQLKKQIMENQEIAESRGATVMSSLTSYINFCEKFTGLTIIDYEINDDVDVAKVTCRQTGKLGSIEYRLEFFADSDGKGQAYYIPLNDELEDRKLATSMNSELQFQQADTGVFIWRLMTYLNRPKSDKK
ncbi:hypothetical protein BCR42DRAFT_37583 [Absidia repens]|uniref:Monopolin complex subunit Csm1/Pcs1 C-terminal domain-containing protein n=1 Tax=Absidia repens TaxID=90262 RepID=A0A1X2IHB1_9FUNG|nr:hypothetical protein BCR42DRAFT_37583 [Absidia repens]